eukprot:5004488-Alexandrium_andersonii.AAC.1
MTLCLRNAWDGTNTNAAPDQKRTVLHDDAALVANDQGSQILKQMRHASNKLGMARTKTRRSPNNSVGLTGLVCTAAAARPMSLVETQRRL